MRARGDAWLRGGADRSKGGEGDAGPGGGAGRSKEERGGDAWLKGGADRSKGSEVTPDREVGLIAQKGNEGDVRPGAADEDDRSRMVTVYLNGCRGDDTDELRTASAWIVEPNKMSRQVRSAIKDGERASWLSRGDEPTSGGRSG
jgi:hypothetical protein